MGKKMTCQAIDAWTFSELVGAFLDLAIAYFLLCGSTLAYIASKLLGLIGLCLPCPCNGLFVNPNKINNSNCFHRLLVDCPPEKISDVQFLVRTKFPFDSVLGNGLNPQLMKERSSESEHVGLEGEASCGSFSREVIGREFSMEEGSFDVKGKVTTSRSLRHGFRRRRKATACNDKSPSVSSFDPLLSEEWAVVGSSASVSKIGNEITECSSVPDHLADGKGASEEDIGMPFEFNEPLDENKAIEKDESPVEEFKCDPQRELDFDGLDKSTIRALEQALEEQHAACSALYLELEKERSAAATAADEAMAMILRLQEEKASIEMEARQYQRMIEEKSAYDAEEMNILKEILVRREREKHFLEKQVEAFRQMFFGIEQLDADMMDTASTQGLKASSLYVGEDPAMMMQRISESVVEKKFKDENDFPNQNVTPAELQNHTLSLGKELPIPEMVEDADSSNPRYIHRHPSFHNRRQYPSRNSDEIIQELQGRGKGMVAMNKNPVDQQREVQRLAEQSLFNYSTSQVLNVPGKTIIPVGQKEQTDDTSSSRGLMSKTTETCDETSVIYPCGDGNVEKHEKDSQSLVFDRDLCVHDVHVIGDELDTCNKAGGKRSEDLLKNTNLDIPKSCDSPTISSSEMGADIRRSKSDVSSGTPRMGFQPGKALLSDFRRNSMSAFDYERLKIDNEVGWLTERLRAVQEGREKLNFCGGNWDREKIQLQLLKDITSQLREIRQLTESGKAAREVSLPPLSSKLSLKKRRSRSVSLGEQRST